MPSSKAAQLATLSAEIACRTVDELLKEEILDSLKHARRKLALWRSDYETVRPTFLPARRRNKRTERLSNLRGRRPVRLRQTRPRIPTSNLETLGMDEGDKGGTSNRYRFNLDQYHVSAGT